MVSIAKRMWMLRTLLAIRTGPGAVILPRDIKKIHLDFAFKINGGHRGPKKFWREYLPSLKYHNPAVSMTVNRTRDQEAPALLSIFYTKPQASTSASTDPSASSASTVTDSSPSTASSSNSSPSPLSTSSTLTQSSSTASSTSTSTPASASASTSPSASSDTPTRAPISTTASPILSSAPTTPTSKDYLPTDHVVTVDMKHRTEADILEEFLKITKAQPVKPTEEEQAEKAELEEDTRRRKKDAEMYAVEREKIKREEDILKAARAKGT